MLRRCKELKHLNWTCFDSDFAAILLSDDEENNHEPIFYELEDLDPSTIQLQLENTLLLEDENVISSLVGKVQYVTKI